MKKIIDENGAEITSPDLNLGYLKADIIIKHHEAIQGVEEQWHHETIAEYPNGGKDVEKVIDVTGVEAREAWDEEIPVQRYVLYTAEELKAIEEAKNRPSTDDVLNALLGVNRYA